MKTVLEQSADGSWAVRQVDAAGDVVSDIPRAWAVTDLCRRLGKSRRQVYRYLKAGWLRPVGKYLGEWLVDGRGLENVTRARLRGPAPIPATMKPYLQEHVFDLLHPVRDSHILIERILEYGTRADIEWMKRQYSRPVIREWFVHHGWRLSARSGTYWSLILGVPIPARPRPPRKPAAA